MTRPPLTVIDYWLIFVILGLFDLRRIRCLHVTDINVPQIVDFRDNVTLSCSYDMSGHTLNSVKWYKDDMEFFRYSPLMYPVYMKFPVAGVQLTNDKNLCNESSCRVELMALSSNSSGVYRCEVSGDAPHFKLTARLANMTVAALPQNNPLISNVNINGTYRFDDFIHANCTTDFSSLPVQLIWYVNDVKASNDDLHYAVETTVPVHGYNLRRQALQLNFYANNPRFHNITDIVMDKNSSSSSSNSSSSSIMARALELRCVAEIEYFPKLRRETTLKVTMMHKEDLTNQKLINSSETVTPFTTTTILLLMILTFTTITVTAEHGGQRPINVRIPIYHILSSRRR